MFRPHPHSHEDASNDDPVVTYLTSNRVADNYPAWPGTADARVVDVAQKASGASIVVFATDLQRALESSTTVKKFRLATSVFVAGNSNAPCRVSVFVAGNSTQTRSCALPRQYLQRALSIDTAVARSLPVRGGDAATKSALAPRARALTTRLRHCA